jgi:ABC-2 type transport system ATP-binding protein
VTVIVTEGLVKRFGRSTALRGLDLEVRRGEVFGLIGPNGAGKTTAMRVLLDIVRPTGGTVRVLGEEPRAGGAALRRRVGYLPGELRLEGRARAGELLQHLAGLSGGVAPGTIERLAERLGLDLSKRVGTLSKGNKQKVGLVQAFMHEPELLVLDEPTSGLDPLVQQEFMALVREAKQRGQTVFLSSHVLGEIEQAADRVGVLHRGELVRVGTLDDVREGRQRRVRAVVTSAPGLVEALGGLERTKDLVVDERDGEARLSLLVEGGVDHLVKALARFQVRDLLIEEPELSDAVMAYYEGVRA